MEPLAILIRANTGIRGLKIGNMEEKIGMYADDTLLYLADSGPSLVAALQAIECMGSHSGLSINWSKSQILPIDHFPPSFTSPPLALPRVSLIKYLGVQVTRSLTDYTLLNIEPLYTLIKTKTQTWARLPLGVMGRVSLVKMILLPKILYLVWHAPLYITQKFFRIIESILNSFIWGHNRHKLSWRVLKNPVTLGGVAFPDFQDYYLASQLSHFYHFDKTERLRYQLLLCEHPDDPAHSPLQSVLRAPLTGRPLQHKAGMLTHHRRVWQTALQKLGTPQVHSHTPLWFNTRLPELLTVPDPAVWIRHGILYIHHIMTATGLKTFQELKDQFSLPNCLLFRYFQLRHAVQTQFTGSNPSLVVPSIVDIVTDTAPSKLISTLYSAIRLPSTTALAYAAKTRWEVDVGLVEDEDWDEILEDVKKVSPKLSDRLTQLYIIHKTYLTPQRIARFKPMYNPGCRLCDHTPASFYHLIWSCPVIQAYWMQVIRFLHDEMGSPAVLDPKMCLLGLLPDLDADKHLRTFLHETLFLARKVVARVWMQALPPTVQCWKKEVNDALPFKKLIYVHRGCPLKYEKVWGRWLADGETCA